MKKPLLVFIAFLIPLALAAQIEFPGKPLSMGLKLKSAPAAINFPGLTKTAEEAYADTLSTRLKAMLFAYPFETRLSSDEKGTWETLPDGSRIWRLLIHSPNALSLNLLFSRFVIPEGAALFLYTPDYQTIRGAYTAASGNSSGEFATTPLPGDKLILELDVPANVSDNPLVVISRVSHDFKGFFDLMKSGDCNVDINCPAGAAWQTEKRAVVKFIRGGSWLCSGALINNTRNNGRPILLTANHTIGTAEHARTSIFYFKFERVSCGSGNPAILSIYGSKLLATTSKVDFCLVELSTTPPKSYEPYYAGWDRRIYAYLDSVTCIHHPNGDAKKISKAFGKILTADFGGGYDTNTHWKISEWNMGTTEPGSSGSPLFNKDHRIVGDLTGGDASCSYNFNDYFEKFSISWDKYPDSTNQLKYWLDPDQTGAFVANGYDPFAGGKPIANFVIRPDKIQAGKKTYITDLSSGLIKTWSWSFDGAEPATSTEQTPTPVNFTSSGIYHVKLIVSNDLGTDSLIQTVVVGESPSFKIGESRLSVNFLTELSDNSSGNPQSVSWAVDGASKPVFIGKNFDLSFANSGEYTVKEIVEYSDETDTLIHYNQVKVLTGVNAFRMFSFKNVADDEHVGFLKRQDGYLPGTLYQEAAAFAEAFPTKSHFPYYLQGITIPVAQFTRYAPDYYLRVYVWNSEQQMVYKDSIQIKNFQNNTRFTKWLKNPISYNDLIYVGYEIPSADKGVFVSKMATDRGEKGANTAYIINEGNWHPMDEYAGVHTSLDIAVEAWMPLIAANETRKIVADYSDGVFTADLGNLIFSHLDVAVFNMNGQKVAGDETIMNNQVNFRIKPPVPGIYVFRLTVDGDSFPTKFLILK